MTYTLEDYLAGLHIGQWFGFSDINNKTHSNLVIHSSYPKPTEQECIEGIAALQTVYSSQEYARKRKAEYDLLNQDELRFDDLENGTTVWQDTINEIKARHPK